MRFFFRKDKKIETSSNSGGSPGKILERPVHLPPHTEVLVKGSTTVNNQQLEYTPQAEPTTEESIWLDRAMEALGKQISGHHTKNDMFAKEMAAYGRPMGRATRCPIHLDSAPPPVAVGEGTTGWLSHLAVRSAHCLKKVGLLVLIASVRGEPYIHSSVGTLPHKVAPLMYQMRLKGASVKIDGPPLTPKQLAAAILYGLHNSCDRDPSFLCTEMRDFVEKGFRIVLPLEA